MKKQEGMLALAIIQRGTTLMKPISAHRGAGAFRMSRALRSTAAGIRALRLVLLGIWLITVLQGFILFAAPAKQEMALALAQGWLRATPNPLGARLGSQITRLKTKTDARGNPLYYVLSLAPEGFVVVSTDTDLEPIIAFSETGDFQDTPANPLAVMLEMDLVARHAVLGFQSKLQANQGGVAAAKWTQLTGGGTGAGVHLQGSGLTSLDDPRVAPLIQSRWNQQ